MRLERHSSPSQDPLLFAAGRGERRGKSLSSATPRYEKKSRSLFLFLSFLRAQSLRPCLSPSQKKQSGKAYAVRAASPEDASAFARVLDACCCCCSSSNANGATGGGAARTKTARPPLQHDAFERKTDPGSAELYFHCTFFCCCVFRSRVEFLFFYQTSVLKTSFFPSPQRNKQTTACSSTSRTCSRTTCGRGRTGPRSSRTR